MLSSENVNPDVDLRSLVFLPLSAYNTGSLEIGNMLHSLFHIFGKC